MTSRDDSYEALLQQHARLKEETDRLRDDNRQLQDALRFLQQLDYLVNASLDPMWISAGDGTITIVNRSFLALVGCASAEEVAGKHVWDFSPGSTGVYASTSGEQVCLDWAYFVGLTEEAARLIEQGECTGWKFYYYNKLSGKVVPTTQNVVYLHDDQGEHIGSFGIIHDLTEIRAAEHRIELARGFLENIFETAGDGLLVTDTCGTIIMANKCYSTMIGCADENLKGRLVYELGLAETATKRETPHAIDVVLEQGTLRGYETVYRRRDGSTVEVELNMTCLRKEDGTLRGIVSSIRDITERRRAEAALRESEEKYRSLVENLSVGVFRSRLDEQGSIIHANTGLVQMAGLDSAEAMLGACIADFYENPDERRALVQELLSQGGVQGREIRFKKANGESRWGSVSATLQYDKHGLPAYLDGIVEDITERRQAAEFLKKSHEKLESMVNERTYELREVNTALRILLRAREEDKAQFEKTMVLNIQNLVEPHIKKLRSLDLSDRAVKYLDILSENITLIAQPLLKGKSLSLLNLTDAEIRIVNLVKQRKSTREIASLTGLSPRTIDRHRDNIRKKLDLNNTKINLTTYLMSLS